jgi:hypothetical protein
MGRETVLFPARWETGEWPVLQPVRGQMSGWTLPKNTKDVPGSGAFLQDPDVVDFAPGSAIPNHFVYWRFPTSDAYAVSPQGHPYALRLKPSQANLTSNVELRLNADQTFISRRQVDTLFTYSVDVLFNFRISEEEVGVTVLLTRLQHIDLGIVLLRSQSAPLATASELAPHFRFRATDIGHTNATVPATITTPIPSSWLDESIRLEIRTINETHYAFSAAPAKQPEKVQLLGIAPATIVSGGNGPFSGTYMESAFDHIILFKQDIAKVILFRNTCWCLRYGERRQQHYRVVYQQMEVYWKWSKHRERTSCLSNTIWVMKDRSFNC